MKAQVKTAFRFHRLDNTFVDLSPGDVVEADEIPYTQRSERFTAGHLVEVKPAAPAAPVAAADATKAPKGKK
jgi:hypothetical protein